MIKASTTIFEPLYLKTGAEIRYCFAFFNMSEALSKVSKQKLIFTRGE